LTRLGLQCSDVALPEQTLLARLSGLPHLPQMSTAMASATNRAPAPLPPVAFERALSEGFEASLAQALAELPPDVTRRLTQQLDKTRKKLELTSAKLAHAYSQALLSHDAQRVGEVRRLKQLLFRDFQRVNHDSFKLHSVSRSGAGQPSGCSTSTGSITGSSQLPLIE